jgi:hypothetical protein
MGLSLVDAVGTKNKTESLTKASAAHCLFLWRSMPNRNFLQRVVIGCQAWERSADKELNGLVEPICICLCRRIPRGHNLFGGCGDCEMESSVL